MATASNDVIERINAAGTGATASFNQTTLKFEIKSDDEESTLTLEDNNTKFLQTLSIVAGSHDPSGSNGPDAKALKAAERRPSKAVERYVLQVSREMNDVFGDFKKLGLEDKSAVRFRDRIEKALRGQMGAEDDRVILRTGLGMSFDHSDKEEVSFEVQRVGANAISRAYLNKQDTALNGVKNSASDIGLVG